MAGNVIATLLVKIGVEVKEMNKGIEQVEGKMKGLKGIFQKNGAKIAATFGVIGGAIGAGLASGVKAAAEFQTELVGLGRISRTSGQELANLGRHAMKMGSEMGIASSEVVKGMADMAKLGYKTNEILSEMPSIMKFAKIKSLDFASALGLTESAMSVFKLGVGGAKKVTDAFLYTMDHSTATLDDLKLGFKYAAPAAKAAGLSVGELSAAVGILARNGTTGSTAGTTLRMALNRLASDAPAVKKGLETLGVTITDSSGKFKPFKQIVEEMGQAMNGLSPKQQLMTANMIFGTNAGSGMLKILKEGPGVFTEFATGAENAGGTVDKAFTKKLETFEEKMNQMKVAFQNLGISLGTALLPAITDIVDGITKLVDKFNDLDPKTQAVIGYIAAAVAAFGSLIAIIAALNFSFGTISTAIGIAQTAFAALRASTLLTSIQMGLMSATNTAYAIGSAIATAATWLANAAFTALGAVLAFITSPIGLVIAALALLAAGIVYLWNENEGFRNAVKSIWEGIKSFFAGIPGFFAAIWNKIVVGTAQWVIKMSLKVAHLWMNIKAKFKEMATGALTWGKDMFKKFADGLSAGFKYVKDKVIQAANWIKSKLGFSVPESGPLSDADTWMPDMMKLLSTGIEAGIPKLQMAVGDVTSTLDLGASATSSVTNNNTINVNSRQNNLDERGLGRMLERMRILNGGTI